MRRSRISNTYSAAVKAQAWTPTGPPLFGPQNAECSTPLWIFDAETGEGKVSWEKTSRHGPVPN
jgi:hypothetical protein